jgi:hypothetical protein
MNYSLTFIGAIAMLFAFLAKQTQVELPFTTTEIENALTVIVGIVGFVITIIGRVRAGGVSIFGFKIK